MVPFLNLALATFNIQGLGIANLKQSDLVIDFQRHGFDIVALQETKVKECMSKLLNQAMS